MTRKQDLPRVRHLRGRHAIALMNMCVGPDVPIRLLRRETGAFEHALAMDPTPKAVYLTSIIRWLLTRRIRHEDARRVRTILSRFDAAKHRLPVEQRDVGRYDAPGDILKILAPHEQETVIRNIPDDILEGCEVVAADEGWMLVRIDQWRAAAWWADSTSWCTRHRDQAESYLRRGPLYVLASAKEKYQFHLQTGQFVDRYDSPAKMMPDMPDAALQAAYRIADGTEVDGVEFVRRGVASQLRAIMGARRGDKVVDLPKSRFAWHDDSIEVWVDSTGTRSVMSDRDPNGFHVRGERAKTTTLLVKRGSTEQRLDSRSLSEDNTGLPYWSTQVLTAFLRSGAARAAAGDTRDGVHVPGPDNEIAFVGRHFLKEVDAFRVVVSNGNRFAMWTGLASNAFSCLVIIDIDAPGRSRLTTISDRAEFLRAPQRIQDAIRVLNREPSSFASILPLGIESLDATGIDLWRTPARRRFALQGLVQRAGSCNDEMAGIADALFSDCAAPLRRLLSCIDVRDGIIRTKTRRQAPTADDLLSCIGIEGSGLLLAALPDEACTPELVDTLIGAGRYEVVNVMPAELFTTQRLRRIVAGGPILAAPLAPRILGLQSYHEVWHDFPQLVRHRAYLRDHVQYKGMPILSALAKTPLPGQSDKEVSALRELGGNFEQYFPQRYRFPVLTAAVSAAFEDVPPVGLPWPFALEELARRPWLIDDVLEGAGAGQWGDPNRCLHEACSVPAVRKLLKKRQADPPPPRLLGYHRRPMDEASIRPFLG